MAEEFGDEEPGLPSRWGATVRPRGSALTIMWLATGARRDRLRAEQAELKQWLGDLLALLPSMLRLYQGEPESSWWQRAASTATSSRRRASR